MAVPFKVLSKPPGNCGGGGGWRITGHRTIRARSSEPRCARRTMFIRFGSGIWFSGKSTNSSFAIVAFRRHGDVDSHAQIAGSWKCRTKLPATGAA